MRERATVGSVLAIACALALGCSLDRLSIAGGGPAVDGGIDAGDIDGGHVDAGDHDGGPDDADVDGGELDGGPDDAEIDGGELDGGELDGGELDGGELDGGVDGGELDGGVDGGEVDGGPPCTAGERSCAGADLLECDATGALVGIETCALGCLDTVAPPRCLHVRATHVDDPERLFDGSADLVVAAGETVEIDTTTGRVIDTSTGTELRAPGGAGDASGLVLVNLPQGVGFPDIAVLSVGALRVEMGGTLVASGSRALIVLASSAITIDGTIDVGGRGRAGGPGAGAGGDARNDGGGPGGGGGGDVAGTFGALQSGGGGGGHAAPGGQGGDDSFLGTTADGGAPGEMIADPDGTPLVGGGGGGAGANAADGGDGGGGGGALQLTSDVSITISSGAIVRSPGSGGRPGSDAGGGGGAGGTVFLEAPVVTVAGGVFANGGGGGGGDTNPFGSASPGTRGLDATTRASGGAGSGGGSGGAGGAGTMLAGENGGDGNGGGGGAAGRVSVRSASGAVAGGGTFSPTDPAAMSSAVVGTY